MTVGDTYHLYFGRPMVCFNSLHLDTALAQIPSGATAVYLHITDLVTLIDHTTASAAPGLRRQLQAHRPRHRHDRRPGPAAGALPRRSRHAHQRAGPGAGTGRGPDGAGPDQPDRTSSPRLDPLVVPGTDQPDPRRADRGPGRPSGRTEALVRGGNSCRSPAAVDKARAGPLWFTTRTFAAQSRPGVDEPEPQRPLGAPPGDLEKLSLSSSEYDSPALEFIGAARSHLQKYRTVSNASATPRSIDPRTRQLRQLNHAFALPRSRLRDRPRAVFVASLPIWAALSTRFRPPDNLNCLLFLRFARILKPVLRRLG